MSVITKSHFNAVAEMFKRAIAHSEDMYPDQAAGAESMRLHLATHMAKVFKEANARFDTTRFLKACGAPTE